MTVTMKRATLFEMVMQISYNYQTNYCCSSILLLHALTTANAILLNALTRLKLRNRQAMAAASYKLMKNSRRSSIMAELWRFLQSVYFTHPLVLLTAIAVGINVTQHSTCKLILSLRGLENFEGIHCSQEAGSKVNRGAMLIVWQLLVGDS